MRNFVLSFAILFVAGTAQAECPAGFTIIKAFIKFTAPVGDCTSTLYHPNGEKAYSHTLKNWYHDNGELAYKKSTKNMFHPSGAKAFVKKTKNWFHKNGQLAFSSSTGNWFHINGKQAYYSTTGNLYDAEGDKIGTVDDVSTLEMLEFVGII